MAASAARLNSQDLARLRASAEENATLAGCWGQENVALVALEWAPRGHRYKWKSHIACNEVRGGWSDDLAVPVLTADVTTFPRGEKGPSVDQYRFWIRRGECGPRQEIRWRDESGRQSFLEHEDQIRGQLTKLFSALQKEHTTVCVCWHRPQRTKQGLQEISFRLPERVASVDLIRVLEYQAMFEAIPESLSNHFEQWLEPNDRSGGFDEVVINSTYPYYGYDNFLTDAPKWGIKGQKLDRVRRATDVAASTVLEILGPKAETRRRGIDKLEKENTALERLSKAAAKGKQHGGKRGERRAPRDLTGRAEGVF
ncbi:uncharacterized protein DNG_05844 [Cephalotrichum gorgonifer]|uniref:Uncharacterized protein n=1 Tax=Cephalotrichum gorgonifer TaxID=2041049 RepID=A0AAE8N1M4_9PEZI|nr:uncharacterized protein DNG_05844 [Cephalotrichum gorgonifer]